MLVNGKYEIFNLTKLLTNRLHNKLKIYTFNSKKNLETFCKLLFLSTTKLFRVLFINIRKLAIVGDLKSCKIVSRYSFTLFR